METKTIGDNSLPNDGANNRHQNHYDRKLYYTDKHRSYKTHMSPNDSKAADSATVSNLLDTVSLIVVQNVALQMGSVNWICFA